MSGITTDFTLSNYDIAIHFHDLNNLESFTKDNLNSALCEFSPKVTKQKGRSQYPGHTLYQIICGIQKHLCVNKFYWKLLEGKVVTDQMCELCWIM